MNEEFLCMGPNTILLASAAPIADKVAENRPIGQQKIRVFVIDQDRSLQRILATYLEQYDMRVVPAGYGQDVVPQLATNESNVVILELPLERDKGFDLLRRIRARSDVPVIVTSGDRHNKTDPVVGLELGADHYLVKPICLRELLARIKAVLRRQKVAQCNLSRRRYQGRYRFGGWELDLGAQRLTDPCGAAVALTNSEYTLLTAFLDAPHQPLSRERLLEATRVHQDIYDRSIDVGVLRLRRKLEADRSSPSIIRTARGVGYVFDLDVEWF
jgi:two-component system OmpR family response regulator